jgi:hypothetical protein
LSIWIPDLAFDWEPLVLSWLATAGPEIVSAFSAIKAFKSKVT